MSKVSLTHPPGLLVDPGNRYLKLLLEVGECGPVGVGLGFGLEGQRQVDEEVQADPLLDLLHGDGILRVVTITV